jgi:hypothetical protein
MYYFDRFVKKKIIKKIASNYILSWFVKPMLTIARILINLPEFGKTSDEKSWMDLRKRNPEHSNCSCS